MFALDMSELITLCVWASFVIWLSIWLLPWRPWSTRESLDADSCHGETIKDLNDVTVLIPARNEADVIQETLHALTQQGENLNVVLVNDQSEDNTAEIAKQSGLENLKIINGKPLEAGWSGKLWALNTGFEHVKTPYTLLLDADIKVCPNTLPVLLSKFKNEKLDFLSLMAALRMQTTWEKVFMPAFIYFFKLLYPFHLSNKPRSFIAAAAGGCILTNTEKLREIGGFHSIKNALIDDCSLAKQIKNAGGKTWIGLTHSVISNRPYPGFHSIWEMVTRTAFTQLHYSLLLLLLCTVLMLLAFITPLAGLFSPSTTILALITLSLSILNFLPIVRYYRLNPLWILVLPIAGFIFLAMTWGSAWKHYFAKGATWKGRNYA